MGRRRTDAVHALDLEYMVEMLRKEPHLRFAEITRRFNEMKRADALELAAEEGFTQDETDALIADSIVSDAYLADDLAKIKREARRSLESNMAGTLMDQVKACRVEIVESNRRSERIEVELESSGTVTTIQNRGKQPDAPLKVDADGEEALALVASSGLAGTIEGERLAMLIAKSMSSPADPPPLRDKELVRQVRQGPKQAQLFALLTKEADLRGKLRAEVRELLNGLEFFARAEAAGRVGTIIDEAPAAGRQRQLAAAEAAATEQVIELSRRELPANAQDARILATTTAAVKGQLQTIRDLQGKDRSEGQFTLRVVGLELPAATAE
jgi:hypothetical protein